MKQNLPPKGGKAQSTVEYILLVTAVIAVVLLATNGQNSLFQSKLANTVNLTINGMQTLANRLTNIAP